MTFWMAAAGLTLLVLLLLLLPLLRGRADKAVETAEYDLTVYKNQLKEITRERERGVLNDVEAKAAEAEIARRILAADAAREKTGTSRMPGGRAVALAVVVAVLVPLGAAGVYLNLGQPNLPGQPFAEREAERAEVATRMPAIRDAIAKLQAKLEAEPENIDGWALLGRSYMTLRDYPKAADAYARATELEPDSGGLQSAYGEALVYAADGMVTERARMQFEEALAKGAQDPRAHFYLARFEYQAGNPQQALDMLVALANSAPADAPWVANVREAAQSIAAELEVDIADRLPTPATPAPTEGGDAAAPALTQEQMASMADMAPEDRQQMIVSMVEGLAARLADEPEDMEGWGRLARAYTVLGRQQEALAAYDHILQRQPDDVPTLLEKARALRTFAGNVPTAESAALMEDVLLVDAENMEALWFTGMAQLRAGDREAARGYFTRALAGLEPGSAERRELSAQVDKLLAQ